MRTSDDARYGNTFDVRGQVVRPSDRLNERFLKFAKRAAVEAFPFLSSLPPIYRLCLKLSRPTLRTATAVAAAAATESDFASEDRANQTAIYVRSPTLRDGKFLSPSQRSNATVRFWDLVRDQSVYYSSRSDLLRAELRYGDRPFLSEVRDD